MAHAVSRPPLALRRLRLVNAHSGETFDGAYRDDKTPIEGVIDELCIFLCDHNSGQKTRIDVGVIDFLADVLDAVGETKATILSAYRTAETNAKLARTTFGVAEHSQHILGRALDIRLDSRLSDAMTRARAMQRGGVGWYRCNHSASAPSLTEMGDELDRLGAGARGAAAVGAIRGCPDEIYCAIKAQRGGGVPSTEAGRPFGMVGRSVGAIEEVWEWLACS
jgi:uncharacterized protein YcbK (DUF882 family)